MIRVCLFVISVALASSASFASGTPSLPDPALTPGAVFANVTAQDVCVTGYSRSVRHVTAATKREVFEAYGVPDGNHTGYCSGAQGCEIDHLVSLELGGSNDADNLWPQPYDGTWNARMKDRLENHLHRLVCNGSLSLAEAQQAIAHDWIAAYRRYIGRESAGN